MKKITEEMHIEKEWFQEAQNQTLETLPNFMNHVINDYIHDYGTICHAISACAIAAAWAADHSDVGGITGFQASFVMWDFIKQWNCPHNECGLKIIDYDNMLFPQYESAFDKVISADIWNSLQKQAKVYLSQMDKNAVQDVKEHWKKIVDGIVPFGYRVEQD